MATYVVKKLLTLVPVLLGVSVLVFMIMHLTPGDPAETILGPDVPQATIDTLRHQLGLDQPIYVQYWHFLRELLHGDLGTSVQNSQPVAMEVAARYPYTLELALVSVAVSMLVGVVTGVLSAVSKGSIGDTLAMIVALMGVSAPSFWVGLMLMLLFAYHLGWFPAAGYGGPLWTLAGWKSVALPALSLGLGAAATVARMTRSSMLEVLSQDYVRTARSKGLSPWRVHVHHAMTNALIPVITIVGLQLGHLLGGAVITEQVFAWPGIGTLVVNAIGVRDFPVVQGVVLVIALSFVLVNLLVDLLYGLVDPRIRYD